MSKALKEPLISVIIPFFNSEKYIQRCLDSVVRQTYKNIEILMINDGSTDNSRNLVYEYEKKDDRIIVLQIDINSGQSLAKELGVKRAKGKFICFIDSDDYVEEDYIEYMKYLLDSLNADLSICEFDKVFGPRRYKNGCMPNDCILEQTPCEAIKNMLTATSGDVSNCCKLYKKQLFKNIHFPLGQKYEDTATTYKIIDNCKKIAYGGSVKYHYIANDESTSRKKIFGKNERDYIANTDKMLDDIIVWYPSLKDEVLRFRVYSNMRVLRILLSSTNKNKKMEQQYKRKILSNYNQIIKSDIFSKRERIAAIVLRYFGLRGFKAAWGAYSLITRRPAR